jgi:hypothetical protein
LVAVLLLMLLPPLQWLRLQQTGLAGGTTLFRRLKLPVRHVDLSFLRVGQGTIRPTITNHHKH